MGGEFAIFDAVRNDLQTNLADVRDRIARAAARSGRSVDKISLVAVSKTHQAPAIRTAIAAGTRIFGENKVQESEPKINEIGRDETEWHLIGHLQSNKARKAVQLFDVIQTIDSLELATRLERICLEESRESLSVFVEVDLAGEVTKSGVSENELSPIVEFLMNCKCLKFDGLMLLPPFFDDAEDARPYFKRLRAIRDELLAKSAFANGLGELSMGMSNDFEIAIEEGATVVRVGTAIFGERSM